MESVLGIGRNERCDGRSHMVKQYFDLISLIWSSTELSQILHMH